MVKKLVIVLILLIIAAACSAVILKRTVENKREAGYGEAVKAFDAGRHEDALALLEPLVREPWAEARRAEIAYRLGVCYSKKGESGKARKHWEEVAASGARAPFYLEASVGLALLMETEGNTAGAAVEYERLLAIAGDREFVPGMMLAVAGHRMETGERVKAVEVYERLREEFPDTPAAGEATSRLGTLNMEALMSPVKDEFSTVHVVKSGENLDRIARRYGNTVEYLQKANRKKDSLLLPGDRLKVLTKKFRIVVTVDSNTLDLFLGEKFVKGYRVGTGKFESTPLGEFKIVNRQVDPVWFSRDGVYPPGHEKNILGTRWLGINEVGYGIHGTTLPETIGQHSSAGCIRMLNREVEEIYDLVPEGTIVLIRESAGE